MRRYKPRGKVDGMGEGSCAAVPKAEGPVDRPPNGHKKEVTLDAAMDPSPQLGHAARRPVPGLAGASWTSWVAGAIAALLGGFTLSTSSYGPRQAVQP